MTFAVERPLVVALLSLCVFTPSSVWAQTEKPGKLAVFRLGGITEKPESDDPLFGTPGSVALPDLLEKLKKAEKDDQVKGVVLLLGSFSAGRAQIEEIRQGMTRFQKSGKPLYAHTGSLSTPQYILLCGADKVTMEPTADLWLTGFFGESPFLRGLLDKLGVVPDYLTCGDYKSAAEMFMRKEPSAEAEEMQNWLLDSIYKTSLEMIAQGRKVEAEQVKKWIDEGPYTAETAKKAGIVDEVATLQVFEDGLKKQFGKDIEFDKKYGGKKQTDVDLSNPFAVLKIWGEILQGAQPKKSTKDGIAIVYVEGPIMEGSAQSSPFGSAGMALSAPIRKALDEVAKDDTIKGMVLRVNSPGGSAVASEIILQATKRVKDKKPFVVSMGDVAGSGGYYVACASDVIFADRYTITGSIGVVGGKFATTKMWDKIGVNFKTYQRGENAGLLSSGQPFTDKERSRMQNWMDEIYGVFKGHVVSIRGEKLKKEIDELAGGRVYTGEQALELGLVDKIGTLDDAVKHVAELAKVTDYETRVVPKPKNFLEMLIEEMSNGDKDSKSLVQLADEPALSLTSGGSLWQAALPLLQQVDPQRLAVVKQAILRLEMIQRERAVLMMPEIRLAN